MQKEGVIKKWTSIADLLFVFRGAVNCRLVASAVGDTRGTSRSIKRDIIERHAKAMTRLVLKE